MGRQLTLLERLLLRLVLWDLGMSRAQTDYAIERLDLRLTGRECERRQRQH